MSSIPYDSAWRRDPDIRDTIDRIQRERRLKLATAGAVLIGLLLALFAATALMYSSTPSEVGPERIGAEQFQ